MASPGQISSTGHTATVTDENSTSVSTELASLVQQMANMQPSSDPGSVGASASPNLDATQTPSPTLSSTQARPSTEYPGQTMNPSIVAMFESLQESQQDIVDRLDRMDGRLIHVENWLGTQSYGLQYEPSPAFSHSGPPTAQESNGPPTSESDLFSDRNEPILGPINTLYARTLSEDLSAMFNSVETFVRHHLTGPYDPRRVELRTAASGIVNDIHSIRGMMESNLRIPLCCAIINNTLNMNSLSTNFFQGWYSPLLEEWRTAWANSRYHPNRNPDDYIGLAKAHSTRATVAEIMMNQPDFNIGQINPRITALRDRISQIISSLVPQPLLISSSNELLEIAAQAYSVAIRMTVSPQDYITTYPKYRQVIHNDESNIIYEDDKFEPDAKKIVSFVIIPLIEERFFEENTVRSVVLKKSEVFALLKPASASSEELRIHNELYA
ncbi:hypothetical protein E4T43_05383 [Aureobasidium subglaciale]|nr:hypothetical protein E4T43_05383 [Aureobasidium subglaciale]